jgi:hypothetical protein
MKCRREEGNDRGDELRRGAGIKEESQNVGKVSIIQGNGSRV